MNLDSNIISLQPWTCFYNLHRLYSLDHLQQRPSFPCLIQYPWPWRTTVLHSMPDPGLQQQSYTASLTLDNNSSLYNIPNPQRQQFYTTFLTPDNNDNEQHSCTTSGSWKTTLLHNSLVQYGWPWTPIIMNNRQEHDTQWSIIGKDRPRPWRRTINNHWINQCIL